MTTVGVDWQEGVGIDWQKTDYCVVQPVWAKDLPLGVGKTKDGKPPFLRFIHAFRDQIQDLPFPFAGDDSILVIDPTHSVTTDGRRASCEIYLVKNAAGDWKIAFRIFLIRTNGVSPIECYDERYVEACEMAMAAVEQSYIDEEENA